jgi:hypothetical protein
MTVASELTGELDLAAEWPEWLELRDLVGEVEPGVDIVWSEDRGIWLSGSYRGFRQIADDPDLFQFPGRDPDLAPEWLDRDFYMWFEGGPKKFQFTQGEEHSRLHRWWMNQFSPKQVAEWREHVIQPLIHELIDAFVDRGSADLMGELARRLPLPVMMRMMDIPADGALMERYLAVGNEFGDLRWKLLSQPADDALRARATEVSLQMRSLLMPYLDERRSGEGEDLISKLWRATPDLIDGEINDDAMYANLTTLFEAGVGTGAGAIGDVLYVLMKFPDYQRRLRDDPSLVPAFVEEAVRLMMPGSYIIRQLREDTEFHGQTLRRGQTIVANSVAAGRDAGQYECPHQVDLTRKGPRNHVGFSWGPRACVGHAIGRAELQEVTAAVTVRLRDVRLDSAQPPPRRVGAGARRPWDRLPALFSVA